MIGMIGMMERCVLCRYYMNIYATSMVLNEICTDRVSLNSLKSCPKLGLLEFAGYWTSEFGNARGKLSCSSLLFIPSRCPNLHENIYLFGALEHFLLFHILGIVIPTD